MANLFSEEYELERNRLKIIFWAAILIFLIPYTHMVGILFVIFVLLIVWPLPVAVVVCLYLIIMLLTY